MFTGIVEELGRLESMRPDGDGRRLRVRCARVLEDLKPEDSLLVNGVCLTATDVQAPVVELQAVAETLSKAKDTSVGGMVEAGILVSGKGKVRLLKPAELSAVWDPATDTRLTNWETVHQLIRVLESGGEGAAADLARKLGAKAEPARELCYRLYTLCERKKRAQEALSYNALVQSWPEIMRLAQEGGKPKSKEKGLFDEDE